MNRTCLLFVICACLALTTTKGQDFKCILQNCPNELMACSLNKDCLSGYLCMGTCRGDMVCIYKCWATYFDNALNNMVDCTMSRHKCIISPDPTPTICRKPLVGSLAKDFDLNYLTGKFYNVYGLNRLYECQNYSHKMFTMVDANTLALTEYYDLEMLNGTARTMMDQQQFSNKGTSSPSILNVTTVGKGMARVDEYRVLSYNETYVFVYYCGASCGISYEGAVVLSRTAKISDADRQAVEAEAKARGYDLSQFCQPKQKPVM